MLFTNYNPLERGIMFAAAADDLQTQAINDAIKEIKIMIGGSALPTVEELLDELGYMYDDEDLFKYENLCPSARYLVDTELSSLIYGW